MMKRARIGIIATAVLAVATMAFAQEDGLLGHAGRRKLIRRRRAPAGGGGGGRGGGWADDRQADGRQLTRRDGTDGREQDRPDLQAGRHASQRTPDGSRRQRQWKSSRSRSGTARSSSSPASARTGWRDRGDHADLVGRGRRPDDRPHRRPWSSSTRLQEDHVGIGSSRLAVGSWQSLAASSEQPIKQKGPGGRVSRAFFYRA